MVSNRIKLMMIFECMFINSKSMINMMVIVVIRLLIKLVIEVCIELDCIEIICRFMFSGCWFLSLVKCVLMVLFILIMLLLVIFEILKLIVC